MTSPLEGLPRPRFSVIAGNGAGPDKVRVQIGDFIRDVEILESSPFSAEQISRNAALQQKLIIDLKRRGEDIPNHTFKVRSSPPPLEQVTFDLRPPIDSVLARVFEGRVGETRRALGMSEDEEGAAEFGESFLEMGEASMKLGELAHTGPHHVHHTSSAHSGVHAAHHASRPVAHEGGEGLTRAAASVGLVVGPLGGLMAVAEASKAWDLAKEKRKLVAEKHEADEGGDAEEVARLDREIAFVDRELHEFSALAIGLKGLAAVGGTTRSIGELASASEGFVSATTGVLAGAGIILSAHSIKEETKRLGHLAEEESLLRDLEPEDEAGASRTREVIDRDTALGAIGTERRRTWNQYKDYRVSQVQQEIVESKWRRRRSFAFLAVSTVALLGAVGVAATLFPGLALAGSISILVISAVVYTIRKPHLVKAFGGRILSGTWWSAKIKLGWEKTWFLGARVSNWYSKRWGATVKAAKIDYQDMEDGLKSEEEVQQSLRAVAENVVRWHERQRAHAERLAELHESYEHIDESIERQRLRYTFDKSGPPKKVIHDFEEFAKRFVKEVRAEHADPGGSKVFTLIAEDWGYKVEEFLPHPEERTMQPYVDLVRKAYMENRHREQRTAS